MEWKLVPQSLETLPLKFIQNLLTDVKGYEVTFNGNQIHSSCYADLHTLSLIKLKAIDKL